jgi:hypothetical protein
VNIDASSKLVESIQKAVLKFQGSGLRNTLFKAKELPEEMCVPS